MKYILLLLLTSVILCLPQNTYACDVCNIYEYKPYNTSGNYIGFFYHLRKFNGYKHLDQSHNFFGRDPKMHDFEGSGVFLEREQQDYEIYQTVAARMNLRLGNKVNLLLIMPYEFIKIHNETVWSYVDPVNDTTMVLQGQGDLITALDYSINFGKEGNKHTLRPGIAVKWPTGVYNKKNAEGRSFDPEIQPGTGSIDFIFRLNYLKLAKSGFGQMASLNYKVNGPTQQSYKFANSINGQVDLFYQFDLMLERFLVPKIGIYAETSGYNTWNGERDELTGGSTYLLDLGLDFQVKRFTVQALYQPVLADFRNGKQIGNAGRLNLGLIYAW